MVAQRVGLLAVDSAESTNSARPELFANQIDG